MEDDTWEPLQRIVKAFAAYRKPSPSAFVVFTYGTMVKVMLNDPEFEGFDSKHQAALHPDDVTAGLPEKNQARWELQKKVPDPIGGWIRRAYKKLVDRGPHRRTTDSETNSHQITDKESLYFTYSANDGDKKDVCTLYLGDNVIEATDESESGRLLDFEEPIASAIITPDRKVLWHELDDGFWHPI